MTEANLRVTFGVESLAADSDDFLKIEQRDWDPYAGKITKGVLANALANMLYFEELDEEGETSPINYDRTGVFDNDSIGPALGDSLSGMSGNYSTNISCSMTGDGYLDTEIYVYPSRRDLEFTMHSVRGRLGGASSGTRSFQELIKFRLTDSTSLSYPVLDINNMEWVGDVYDEDGGIITRPSAIFEDGLIKTDLKVYGSLLVNYDVYRRVYSLRISGDSDLDRAWDDVVYGVYLGGVDWLEVDADDNSSLDSSMCRGGGGIRHITDDDDDYDPDESGESDRYTKIDYCTQTIKSDSYS